MASKRESGPARDGTALECARSAASTSSLTTTSTAFQASRLAHRAVAEMLAAGVPAGGDRQRVRSLIREAKDRGGAYWDAFRQTVLESAGRAPQ